jgi:hypothetical protein
MPTRTTRIAGSIQIDVSPGALFEVVSDQRNEPEYNHSMHAVSKQTPGPVGVGTVFRAETRSGRRVTPMTIEVTTYEPPRHLDTVTRLDAMTITGGLTLDPALGGTRLRWDWDLQPKGGLARVMPLVRWLGNRQERRIWTGLKAYVEDAHRHPAHI